MPIVWVRGNPKHTARFHRVPDCRQLRKRPAQGEAHELITIDLAELGVRPCRTCYPDAPNLKVRKAYCELCQSKRACEHNGGVLITDRAGRHMYVWPDTNQMPLYRRTST